MLRAWMLRGAFAALIGAGAVGCGGGALPPPEPAPLAACLTFLVQEDGASTSAYEREVQKRVRAAMEASLVTAGFNVQNDPSAPHDVVVRIATTPGSRVESGARVRAKLELQGQGARLDTLEASAPQESGDYDAQVAEQLVDAMFRSGGLAAFTKSLRKPGATQRLAVTTATKDAGPACAPAVVPVASVTPAVSVAPAAPATPSPADELAAGPPQPNDFAFVVGVETYKGLPAAPGARADAERFALFAKKTLGVPESHVKLVLDEKADKLAFELNSEWVKLNIPTGGRIWFYFAGHGGNQKGFPFVLPYDGDPKSPDKTSISINGFLQQLTATRAKQVIAVIDAGFSGAGGRSASGGERPPTVLPDPAVPQRAALIAAVTSVDVAGGDRSGGLFTRLLLEGLGRGRADVDGDGQITLQELMAWAPPRVARAARREQRSQTPNAVVGAGSNAAQIVLVSGLPAQ